MRTFLNKNTKKSISFCSFQTLQAMYFKGEHHLINLKLRLVGIKVKMHLKNGRINKLHSNVK
jgi:hypothetical protein